jgi:hypothetical protein
LGCLPQEGIFRSIDPDFRSTCGDLRTPDRYLGKYRFDVRKYGKVLPKYLWGLANGWSAALCIDFITLSKPCPPLKEKLMNEMAALIAPCGMNCSLCMAWQRTRNHCSGCRGPDEGKSKSCAACAIKTCNKRTGPDERFCHTCAEYPCTRVKKLDRRYREKYGMSMIENLGMIRTAGIDAFIQAQERKWTCPACGKLLSVHRPFCLRCGSRR